MSPVPLLLTYLAAISWVLVVGWQRLVHEPGANLRDLALFIALGLLTALPLILGGLYRGTIVQEVSRADAAHQRARRATQESLRTKLEFLATVSHEVRTPLNGILGFSELLAKSPLNSRQRESVQAIQTSGTHLLSIINDVLDYSKIDAGRIELDDRPVDVGNLIESALQSVSVAARKRGLTLHAVTQPNVPKALFGDATRLRQVLLNLLANAVKFTDTGSVTLTTSAKVEPDGRYRIRFEVADTGIGMSLQDQRRLFKAFTQLDPAARSRGGTGLGLAISQRLCRLMGGDLEAYSQPGKGSTFSATVCMPGAPEVPFTEPLAELKGRRLLVVDGNPLDRTLVARHAQAWGMTTRVTGDPVRALAWLQAGDPFDLALLGHHNGGLDAFALARRLQAAGQSGLPLILAAEPQQLIQHPPTGAFLARLAKPLMPVALAQTLRECVADRPTLPPPAQAKSRGRRILLVEDNAMNRLLALRILEGLGHEADVAVNGLEAVRAVGSKEYDVVLMDVQMPGMDGLEATRTIYRKVPPAARPRIIGLSANALPGDREQCLRAGMDDYLSKPFHPAQLAALLNHPGARGQPRAA